MQIKLFLFVAVAAAISMVMASSLDAGSDVLVVAERIRRHHARGAPSNNRTRKQKKKGKKSCKNKKSSKKSGKKNSKSTTKSTTKDTAAVKSNYPAVAQSKGLPKAFQKGKAGIVYADPSLNLNRFTGGKVGWTYNWRATPWGNETPNGAYFIPMLWGTKDKASGDGVKRFQEWREKIESNPTSSNPFLAGGAIAAFNEADLWSQGDMNIWEACDVMRKHMIPVKKSAGVKLIGPSTVMSDQWYKDFRQNCRDVYDEIDYDSVHDYNVDPQTTINNFEKHYKEHGKPLVITEFGCKAYNGQPDCWDIGQSHWYVSTVTKWAMQTPYVIGISVYGVMHGTNINSNNALVNGDGSPNALWNTFLSSSN